MQTFLPYADFRKSASVLDGKRLSNQRRECLTLLNGGWPNHPASKMWAGHRYYLALYALEICQECIRRGYKDSREIFIPILLNTKNNGPPEWFGLEEFHRSHRSNLLRKKPEHYSKYFVDVSDDLPYFWPTKEGY